jgi:hypothetical protein
MMFAQVLWLFAATGGSSLERPLQLIAEPTQSGVSISIVGDSDAECVVEYELLVEGGQPGNGNRSVQRGKAHLLPNRKIVVAKTSLGMAATPAWNARLLVKACDGNSYELTSGSGD